MATLRALIGMAVLLPSLVAAAEDKQEPSHSPDFPLIVRIDERALDSLREDVCQEGGVDQFVLGTRAVGKSWTSGAIDVDIVPNQDDATFVLRFKGKAHTSTTGSNGPALIRSRTLTDFECTRQVTFDPQEGMVAGPTKVVAQTTLVFDGFDSNRRLGSRLIRRIAERRANAQFPQAQAIAQRDNEAEILRAFDKRLDSQLAAINRQIGIARYVRSLLGPTSKPRMASCSTKGCILVGIGNAEDPQKLLACPPDCQSHAPLEIWIHRSILGERLVSFTSVLQKLDQGVVLTPPQFEVLQLMPGLRTADRPFALSLTEGWLVIGVPREPETIVLASSNR